MKLTNETYVPAIRWRMGEYQALSRLSDDVKDRIVPFISIPEIEFDFELWQPKKTAQEHVHPFSARYKKKWDKRPAWIGVHKSIADKKMDDGRDILTYVFEALRDLDSTAIPAIALDSSPTINAAVTAIVKVDQRGAAISIRLEDLMKADAKSRIETLCTSLALPLNMIDLVIDLGAPNFEPYTAFAGALVVAVKKLGDLNAYRNFVIIGTAIPESFKDLAKGSDRIVRHDWKFYCSLLSLLPKEIRRPNFGDYTIVHPEFTPIDMRKIKSSGKVVYTTSKDWFVRKGGAFRDNPAQMHGHCAAIIDEGIFKGAAFSSGDEFIADCAVKKVKPSNQPYWKFVTINHHITHVVDDLAKLAA